MPIMQFDNKKKCVFGCIVEPPDDYVRLEVCQCLDIHLETASRW
jgi:hypothetical protein